jgi:hypothetical protein
MRLQLVATLILSLLTLNAFATDVYSDEYNTIESVEMFEVHEDALGYEVTKKVENGNLVVPANSQVNTNNKSGGIGQYIMVAKEIIAFGKEVYKIIEAGKPVVNVGESVPLSILPKDEKGQMVDAFMLENWKMPKTQKYRVRAKNGFGMTTISFDFMLIYTYGGKYNGKGAYITGAEVAPTQVDVAWGYNLDAQMKVKSIFNQGTSESPVAAAVLEINYTIKTVLKESRSTKKFMVNGLGQSQGY